MPIPIQDSQATAALRRAFKFVGRIAPRLDETISPVAVVTDTSRELPPGVVPVAVSFAFSAAVAAERASFRFEVPPTVLAVVTKIGLATGTAGQIFRVAWGSQLAGPFNLSPSTWADGRLRGSNVFPPPRAPGARLAQDTQVGAITEAFNMSADSGNGVLRMHDVYWPVGGLAGAFDFLEFQQNAVNDTARISLQWLEFAAVTTTL